MFPVETQLSAIRLLEEFPCGSAAKALQEISSVPSTLGHEGGARFESVRVAARSALPRQVRRRDAEVAARRAERERQEREMAEGKRRQLAIAPPVSPANRIDDRPDGSFLKNVAAAVQALIVFRPENLSRHSPKYCTSEQVLDQLSRTPLYWIDSFNDRIQWAVNWELEQSGREHHVFYQRFKVDSDTYAILKEQGEGAYPGASF
jgi:hypothetical protein